MDAFNEKFEMPTLNEQEAQQLEETLRDQLLGYTNNTLGDFYFMDVTLLSSPPLKMKQKVKLRSLLNF